MTLVEPSPADIVLRRYRADRGLTQEELAERAGRLVAGFASKVQSALIPAESP